MRDALEEDVVVSASFKMGNRFSDHSLDSGCAMKSAFTKGLSLVRFHFLMAVVSISSFELSGVLLGPSRAVIARPKFFMLSFPNIIGLNFL